MMPEYAPWDASEVSPGPLRIRGAAACPKGPWPFNPS
jgi:hypothetical protein